MATIIKKDGSKSTVTGSEPKKNISAYDNNTNNHEDQLIQWCREGTKSIPGKRTEIVDTQLALEQARCDGFDYITALAFQKDQFGLKAKWRGDFVIDVDDTNSIPRAHKESKKIATYLLELGVPEEALQICYTGKKGYRIYVDSHALNLKENAILNKIHKQLMKKVSTKLKLKLVDFAVYNHGQLLRQLGVQRKNGSFAIPLSLGELMEMDYKSHKKLAADKRSANEVWPEWTDPYPVPKLVTLVKQAIKEADDIRNREYQPINDKVAELESPPPCIEVLRSGDFEKQDGRSFHEHCISLIAYGIAKGETSDEIVDKASGFCEKIHSNSYPSPEARREHLRKEAVRELHKQQLQFFCGHVRALLDGYIDCRKCPIGQEEVARNPYHIHGGHFCLMKKAEETISHFQLCNFVAKISREIVRDDGSGDTEKDLDIELTLASGESLGKAKISTSEFESLNWLIKHFGAAAIIEAGISAKSHVRTAIQKFSDEVEHVTIYSHTGWRKVGDAWIYIHPGGAIGAEGINVDIGPGLIKYGLPDVVIGNAELKSAIEASLAFLTVAPMSISAPTLASIYAAPIATFLDIDFSLYMEGSTGTLKSTLSGLALSHFGMFDQSNLPANFTDTANAIERKCYVLKDMLIVVDDYAPSSTRRGADEIKRVGDRIFRSAGNRSGRGRLKSDLTTRRIFYPRGLLIATGEQLPDGMSIQARIFVIHLNSGDVDIEKLSDAQRVAAKGVYGHAMAGYIAWLTLQVSDEWIKALRARVDYWRQEALQSGGHLRLPAQIGKLMTALESWLGFAVEKAAVSDAERKLLLEEALSIFINNAKDHASLLEQQNPVYQFITAFNALMTQGKVHLAPKAGGDHIPEYGGLSGDLVGWVDESYLYLIPDLSYKVIAQLANSSGSYFGIDKTALWRRFEEAGVLVKGKVQFTKTVTCGEPKRKRRVLKLLKQRFEEICGESGE